MSRNIAENSTFLKLLFDTSQEQQRSLLFSLTDSQLRVIKEIFVNLTHLIIPRKVKKILKRPNFIKLSKRKTSLKQSRNIVQRYHKDIIYVLLNVKTQLQELL